MNPPSAADMYDAIRLNSVELLHSLLDDGASVHMDLSAFLPLEDHVSSVDEDGMKRVSEEYFACRRPHLSPTSVAAIHLAVVLCFRGNHQATGTTAAGALSMLHFLLCQGANPLMKCMNFTIPFIFISRGEAGLDNGRLAVAKVSSGSGARTALSLAERLFLRARGDDQIQVMKEAVDMLRDPTALSKKPHHISKLLLSDKFSDVAFFCSDGVEVPAHKNVLASASNYFDTYFDGPWGEQHADGKWTTEYSSDVIKAVLAFVYTENIPLSALDSETLMQSLMKVAHEWSLPKLFRIAEACRSRSVSSTTLLACVEEVKLYDAKVLRRACVKYMKANLQDAILENPYLTATLASDHPDVWSEISEELQPARKKLRLS